MGMARLAKGHKVIFGVSATVIDSEDMVYLVNGNIASGFKASFTQGMLGYIRGSNLAPTPTVNLVMLWRTLVFIILPAGSSLVCGTITAFTDGGWTAGISTGFLG